MQRPFRRPPPKEALPARVINDEVSNIDDRSRHRSETSRGRTPRHGSQELLSIGMLRHAQELFGLPLLDDLALAHHNHAVGVAGHH